MKTNMNSLRLSFITSIILQLLVIYSHNLFENVDAFVISARHGWTISSPLCMTPMQTLKPAAVPLLEAGKALAKSGEIIIDISTTTTSYLGFSWKAFQMSDDNGDTASNTLSPYLAAIGACIRTAGDCIAQAGALMRFKTGHELVVVELRDASYCFCHQLGDTNRSNGGNTRVGATSATAKAEEALDEINIRMKDVKNQSLEWDQAKQILETMIPLYYDLGKHLEAIGVGIVENSSPQEIGSIFMDISVAVESLSSVPISLGNQQKKELINEWKQELSKSALLLKDSGTILGAAAFGGDEGAIGKGKKSWMKK